MNILPHFLTADPIIHNLWQKHQVEPLKAELNSELYFAKLCRAIIGQQLSVKAAATINERFVKLLPDLSPQAVVDQDDQSLRDVGLSWAKIKYVKDLAQKTLDQELILANLPELDDEAIIAQLTSVKGIGRWTAEMFLIFTLGREDVFSFGDLGLRRAMERHYGLTDWQHDHVMSIVEKWAPYRSYASLVLWRSLDAPQSDSD